MNKQQIIYMDNKPHIKCNVVILESEQDSKLQLQMNNRLHYENGNSIALKSYQHLYITSDEEIKEGDWSYNDILKEIVQNNCSSNRLVSINANRQKIHRHFAGIDRETGRVKTWDAGRTSFTTKTTSDWDYAELYKEEENGE